MHLFLNKHLNIGWVSQNFILLLVITESNLIFRIQYVWFLGVFGGLFREVFASTIPEPRHQSMFTPSPPVSCAATKGNLFFLSGRGRRNGKIQVDIRESFRIFQDIFTHFSRGLNWGTAWPLLVFLLDVNFARQKNGCSSQRIGSHEARLFGLTYFTHLKWTIHHECVSCNFIQLIACMKLIECPVCKNTRTGSMTEFNVCMSRVQIADFV